MKQIVKIIGLFGILLSPAQPAFGGSLQDFKACDNSGVDKVVALCNVVVDNAKQSVSNRAIAFGNRSWGFNEAGEYDKSIASADESIRLDRGNAYVFNNRSYAYYKKGEFKKAIADCDEALKIDPNFSRALNNRASYLYEVGEYGRAVLDFDKAIKIDPTYLDNYLGRSLVYEALGKHEKAIADSDYYIKHQPKDAEGFNNRGWARLKIGDYDKAIADATIAIKLKSNDSNYFDTRGAAFLKKGSNVEAIKDFTSAIERKPNEAGYYRQRAVAKLALAELQGALADAEKALTLKPDDVDAQKTLADVQAAKSALTNRISPPPAIAAQQEKLPAAETVVPSKTVEVPPTTLPAVVKLAPLGRRVALIIGNSAYPDGMALANPVNDANAMAASLKRLGFDVVLTTNATKADMSDAMYRFAVKSEGADAAFVFYAGHGMQVDGVNYLMPIDGALETQADLKHKFVAADEILDDLKAVKGMRMMVLDACRNNPLSRSIKLKLAKVASRAVDNRSGLADMKAEGVLIAFATQPNEVAADGEGADSPFTLALLKHLETPNIEIDTMFKRVRTTVSEMTDGGQLPQTVNSSTGEFYLKQN
jgi:tetratricopeptide (TPR) repeat protein